mmetsp:Transcript_5409/g.17471  ORF Transcript_5409/g.17471 Transcript_5409/m.17471 type:complete len:203 (-) Transcript_5409:1412-2020(-)
MPQPQGQLLPLLVLLFDVVICTRRFGGGVGGGTTTVTVNSFDLAIAASSVGDMACPSVVKTQCAAASLDSGDTCSRRGSAASASRKAYLNVSERTNESRRSSSTPRRKSVTAAKPRAASPGMRCFSRSERKIDAPASRYRSRRVDTYRWYADSRSSGRIADNPLPTSTRSAMSAAGFGSKATSWAVRRTDGTPSTSQSAVTE